MTLRMAVIPLLFCLSWLSAADPLHRAVSIPRKDVLPLGELLAPIAEELGWPGELVRPLMVPVFTATLDDTLTTLAIRSASSKAIRIELGPDLVTIHLDRLQLRRARLQFQVALRTLIERLAPGQAALAHSQRGLFLHGDHGRSPMPDQQAPDHLVLLVHGLDEPGRCWKSTVPALRNHGLAVAEFIYANDQGVLDSIQNLHQALRACSAAGTTRIDLVGHSLGGLLIRGVVGDPAAYANTATAPGLPVLRRIITVGTPHAGSPMARFRFAAEARDQLAQWFSGNGLLFGSILDGAGEAQIDLLPGSVVLDLINARPLPSGVVITTIAGDGSPFDSAAIRDHLFNWEPARSVGVDAFSEILAAVSAGQGDGVVSLGSARWPGVEDHVIVHANHTAMLQPEFPGDPTDPPAVPIIVERLIAP